MSEDEKVKVTIEGKGIRKEIEGGYMFGGMITEYGETVDVDVMLIGEREPIKIGVDIAKVCSRIFDSLPEVARRAYILAVIEELEVRRNEVLKNLANEASDCDDIDEYGEILGNKAFKK